MRNLQKVSALAMLFGSALAANTTTGQIQVSFDENGHGLSQGVPLGFATQPDPISGIPTLVYSLPFQVVPGDLVLMESIPQDSFSDIVRFYQDGRVFFFSNREPTDLPPFDLADVSVLPPPQSGAIPLVENGPEGNNGVLWNPGPGQPGYPGGQITYNIISDAVPEPGGIALAGLAAVGLLALKQRIAA